MHGTETKNSPDLSLLHGLANVRTRTIFQPKHVIRLSVQMPFIYISTDEKTSSTATAPMLISIAAETAFFYTGRGYSAASNPETDIRPVIIR